MSERSRGKYSESITVGQHTEGLQNHLQTILSNRPFILRGPRGLTCLALIGRALKIHDTGENDAEGYRPSQDGQPG